MDFWEKVKRDLQKGIKEGIEAVKEGATYVREKAEELTEEGKRRIRLFDLKTKVQKEMSELGGRVYSLGSKDMNPMLNKKVKTLANGSSAKNFLSDGKIAVNCKF